MQTITLNIPEGAEQAPVIHSDTNNALNSLMIWLEKLHQPNVAKHLMIDTYGWVIKSFINHIGNENSHFHEMNPSFDENIISHVGDGNIFHVFVMAVDTNKDSNYYWIILHYNQSGKVYADWMSGNNNAKADIFHKFTDITKNVPLDSWHEGHALIQKIILRMEQIPELPK